MTDLKITGARLAYGTTEVLKSVDLAVADGEYMVIVGPSGCGKSTLLRAIAGLEDLDAGDIRIGGRDVASLPPAQRGIAMVFQSYALYPHMTLYENMAFALKLAKKPDAEIRAAVANAADILGITHMLDRKPAALSGGQRQRVAIGRAIVRQPDIFLFDEPLSNLDAALRVKMRYEFATLHRKLATTTVYVTHDQVEAMTLADRITVMNAGRIEQVGTPAELYAAPANRFVAGFIGSPQMNFLEAQIVTVEEARVHIACPSTSTRFWYAAPGAGRAVDEKVTLGIRPEDLRAGGTVADQDAAQLEARVRFIERLGGMSTVHFGHPDSDDGLCWQTRDAGDLSPGAVQSLAFDPAAAHLFDADGMRIAPVAEQSVLPDSASVA